MGGGAAGRETGGPEAREEGRTGPIVGGLESTLITSHTGSWPQTPDTAAGRLLPDTSLTETLLCLPLWQT